MKHCVPLFGPSHLFILTLTIITIIIQTLLFNSFNLVRVSFTNRSQVWIDFFLTRFHVSANIVEIEFCKGASFKPFTYDDNAKPQANQLKQYSSDRTTHVHFETSAFGTVDRLSNTGGQLHVP
jgi:hypothetical protein